MSFKGYVKDNLKDKKAGKSSYRKGMLFPAFWFAKYWQDEKDLIPGKLRKTDA